MAGIMLRHYSQRDNAEVYLNYIALYTVMIVEAQIQTTSRSCDRLTKSAHLLHMNALEVCQGLNCLVAEENVFAPRIRAPAKRLQSTKHD